MEELKTLIVFLSVVIMFINTPVCFILIYKFLKKFRERHNQLWQDNGSPTLIMNNGIGNGVSVISFLFTKKYLITEDQEFISIANKCRLSLLVGMVAFFICVVALFSLK